MCQEKTYKYIWIGSKREPSPGPAHLALCQFFIDAAWDYGILTSKRQGYVNDEFARFCEADVNHPAVFVN